MKTVNVLVVVTGQHRQRQNQVLRVVNISLDFDFNKAMVKLFSLVIMACLSKNCEFS